MRHPKWSMGAKISVDSATMMNKGLEVIEAHHLFGVPEPAIEVVVHPQSIVHSLVAFTDGSVLAQLGEPDMRIPIACTLGWPGRLDDQRPVPGPVRPLGAGVRAARPRAVSRPCGWPGSPCGRVGLRLLY